MDLNPIQAGGRRDQLLHSLEIENKATMSVLEHIPEDKLGYRPDDRLKTAGELAWHIYTVGIWFAVIIETGRAELSGEGMEMPEAPSKKAELIAACQGMYQDMAKRMAAVTPEQLAAQIPFGDFGTYPGITYLDWHQRHLIHHRGQLTVYLRLMGAKVPGIYGDSLDYPM